MPPGSGQLGKSAQASTAHARLEAAVKTGLTALLTCRGPRVEGPAAARAQVPSHQVTTRAPWMSHADFDPICVREENTSVLGLENTIPSAQVCPAAGQGAELQTAHMPGKQAYGCQRPDRCLRDAPEHASATRTARYHWTQRSCRAFLCSPHPHSAALPALTSPCDMCSHSVLLAEA